MQAPRLVEAPGRRKSTGRGRHGNDSTRGDRRFVDTGGDDMIETGSSRRGIESGAVYQPPSALLNCEIYSRIGQP